MSKASYKMAETAKKILCESCAMGASYIKCLIVNFQTISISWIVHNEGQKLGSIASYKKNMVVCINWGEKRDNWKSHTWIGVFRGGFHPPIFSTVNSGTSSYFLF